MSRLAIVGAGGFIGRRAVELLGESGFDIVPVARRATAPNARTADAFDQPALTAALAGCDIAVSLIAGDFATIVESVAPLYAAAEAAGVGRLLYLSSAAVHGQAPAPGTDETAPLSLDQPFDYNRAKILAERKLLDLRRAGGVEIVILRPGIVYGPRSQWTDGLAAQIVAGAMFLADGGSGICNAIFVDNLVHAIALAASAELADSEAFLLNDRETVTWADLVAPIADSLGAALGDISRPSLARALAPPSLASRLLRRAGFQPRRFSRELALLESCRVRLPTAKAERLLGFAPPVSFAEGCRRSVEGLMVRLAEVRA